MDTTKAITHVSLCAGYGGIDLGLSRAIPNLRTVAFSEIEAFACANLVAKMEEGLLDAAPIWTNLKTFPWSEFCDRVDILSGGYPCQPFSAAGKRLGTEDPRHLWPFIADGIRAMRPRVCFFENVEGHITLGLREVISELESIGYKVAWGIFSASECGAPHQRKRVFILAVASGFGGASGLSGPFPRHEGQSGESDDGGGEIMADSECSRLVAGRNDSRQTQRPQSEHCNSWPSRPGELGNAISERHEQNSRSLCKGQGETWTIASSVIADSSATAWPSRPGQPQHEWEPPRVVGHTIVHGHSASEISGGTSQSEDEGRLQESKRGSSSMGDTSDWSNGQQPTEKQGWSPSGRSSKEIEPMADDLRGRLPHATDQQRDSGADDHAVIGTRTAKSRRRQTQPPLGGDADGPTSGLDYAELYTSCDNRTDELRLLGNGVVPATAERAFRTLLAELIP